MHYRTLGSTGIKVSEIGFGGWAIGGATDVGRRSCRLGKRQRRRIARRAPPRARPGRHVLRYRGLYGYGRSESLLGIVLSRLRDQVVIATKVGNVRTTSGRIIKDFSKRHIFYAIDGSLKRLRTDYVDLYQLHNPTLADLEKGSIQEAMEMLQDSARSASGASRSRPPTRERSRSSERLGIYPSGPLQRPEPVAGAEALSAREARKNFGIIARVPLASGLLTGKFRLQSTFSGEDVRQNFLTPRRLAEALERIAEVKGIVGGDRRSLGEAALRFVLADEAVSTVIPGARNAHQVEINVSASDATLDPEIVASLRERLGDYNFYQRHSIRV